MGHAGGTRGAGHGHAHSVRCGVPDSVRQVPVPATLTEIAEALDAVLADGVARTAKECARILTERGLYLGRDPDAPVEDLLDGDDLDWVLPLTDDRHVSLPALLAGRVFTHRVTASEVRCGFLSTTPDLEALSMLTDDDRYCRLVDGREFEELLPDFDDEQLAARGIDPGDVGGAAWLLPPDVLSGLGLSAGSLVAVSLEPAGLTVRTSSASEVPESLVASLQAWTHRLADGPEQIDTVLWELCADDPALFRSPLPPVAELFEHAGLEVHGDQVAPAGFDMGRHRVERRMAWVADTHGLDEDEALAVLAIARLYERIAQVVAQVVAGMGEGASLEEVAEALGITDGAPAVDAPGEGPGGGDRQVVRELLPLLAEPAVAAALLVETLGPEREGAAALGVFADSLEGLAPAVARPAVRWLRGKALDRLGDPVGAEATFESALALDPTHALSLYDLARIASDRGDAERGLSLLRRADAPSDDDLVILLEHFRPVERTDLGRNAPCWCGSGRKYKVCHRNNEQQPLEERAAWLYQKAGTYLQDGPWRTDLLELARIRSQHLPGQQGVMAAVQEPLVSDAVLFEGGAFQEFLHDRGVLLPDDEQLLAQQWLLRDRSLYEVEDVRPGQGFTARDLRTGDRLTIRERAGSRQLQTGMLLCARLVPTGDTFQCFGGLEPVELWQRDGLLELLDSDPDPAELVRYLSARFAPPTLQNTEGEPLMFCETILRSPDPAALAAALDAVYESTDSGDDSALWLEHVTTHGTQRIRATISLTGSDVTVETNSDNRRDRVLQRLTSLQPGLQVVTETRRAVEDMQEAASRAPRGATTAGALDPRDPAVAAALDQFIHDQEQAWLDEPIPALGGATPRQAADDPTRRQELIRLIDGYGPGGPGTMDPDRLRGALGL